MLLIWDYITCVFILLKSSDLNISAFFKYCLLFSLLLASAYGL